MPIIYKICSHIFDYGQLARIKRGLADFSLNLYTSIDFFEHKLFYLSRVYNCLLILFLADGHKGNFRNAMCLTRSYIYFEDVQH
jgi:hypothetical protein